MKKDEIEELRMEDVKEEQCSCGAGCKCKRGNGTLIIVFVLLMFVCLIGGLIGGYMLKFDDKDNNTPVNTDSEKENQEDVNDDNLSNNNDDNLGVVPLAENKVIKVDDLKGLNKYFDNGTVSLDDNLNLTFYYGDVNGINVKLNFISNKESNNNDEYNGDYQRVSLKLNDVEYLLYSENRFFGFPINEFAQFEIYPYKDGVLFVENEETTWDYSDVFDPFIRIYAYNKNGKMFEIKNIINNYYDKTWFNDLNEISKCSLNVSGEKITYCKATNKHESEDGEMFDVEFYEFDSQTEKVVKVVNDQYIGEQ